MLNIESLGIATPTPDVTGTNDVTSKHIDSSDLTYKHIDNSDQTYKHLDSFDLTNKHLDSSDVTYKHIDNSDLTYKHLDSSELTYKRDAQQDYTTNINSTHFDYTIKTNHINHVKTKVSGSNIIDKALTPPNPGDLVPKVMKLPNNWNLELKLDMKNGFKDRLVSPDDQLDSEWEII